MPQLRRELELKLLASTDFEMPTLDGHAGVTTVSENEPQELWSIYHDTEDYRLFSLGITLRHRTGDEHEPGWTLKLPGGGDIAVRNEIEFPGKADSVPQEALDLLLAVCGGSELVPVTLIKVRRLRWSLTGSNGVDLAELVDDRVAVLDGNRIVDSFREIEVEARRADSKHLRRIVSAIRNAGAIPDQRSKLNRALTAIGVNLRSVAPADSANNDPGFAVQAMLAADLHRMLVHDPYARLADVEGVHQMRVGSRRMRSLLRTFGAVIGAEATAAVTDDLRWLGRLLGGVRDLDILGDRVKLHGESSGAVLDPVLQSIALRHAAAVESLHDGLSSTRYLSFLNRLEGIVTSSDTPSAVDAPNVYSLGRRAFRKFEAAASALTPGSEELQFHRVRILAKRARYAAEGLASLTKSRRNSDFKCFAKTAEHAQNVLGEYRDALLVRDRLSDMVADYSGEGAPAFWLGRLAEREEQRANGRREEFLKSWRRLGRKGDRRTRRE